MKSSSSLTLRFKLNLVPHDRDCPKFVTLNIGGSYYMALDAIFEQNYIA